MDEDLRKSVDKMLDEVWYSVGGHIDPTLRDKLKASIVALIASYTAEKEEHAYETGIAHGMENCINSGHVFKNLKEGK